MDTADRLTVVAVGRIGRVEISARAEVEAVSVVSTVHDRGPIVTGVASVVDVADLITAADAVDVAGAQVN